MWCPPPPSVRWRLSSKVDASATVSGLQSGQEVWGRVRVLTTDSKELPRGAVTEPFQSDTQPTPQLSRRFRGFNRAAYGLRGLVSIRVLLAHIIGGTARHIYPQNAAYVKGIEHPWYLGT